MKRWPIKPLGELLTVQNGFAFKSELFNENGKGFPIIRIRDLARGFSETFYDGEHDSIFEIERGDFLIGMDGEFRCYCWQGGKALLNQRVCRLQDFSRDLNPGYVFYGINDHLREIEDNTGFVTVKHLSSKQIASIEMSVPPLVEQERIVKLLDEADELRKLRAQADRRTADLIPSLFHEMFGDPFTNPKGCSVVRIDEAGRVQLGRQRAPKYQTGKFARPYVRVANVYEDEIDVDDLLSMDFDERDFAKYRLDHGDILLNEGQSTELVGRPAMWRNEIADCCFQNTLVRFQPDRKRVLPDFALAVFLAYFRGGNFANISSKTSNVAHLGAARFAKMSFPLPPLPQQKEFAARVSEIRAMQVEQTASRRRLDNLFQSMLHRAFQSEL